MKINDNIIAQVYETYNYSKFRKLEFNRSVLKDRKEKLMASFRAGEVMNPIVVNEKDEIIDGQGRFEARKELGLPIQYVIAQGANIDDCRRMNQYNSKWSTADWVTSHAESGNQNFVILRDVNSEVGLGYVKILRLCNKSGGGRTGTSITEGTLIFTQKDADTVRKVVGLGKEIVEALVFTSEINAAFYTAVKVVCETPGYKHEKMLNNCRNCRSTYNQMAGLESQLKEFSRIYNYRAATKDKLYFERYMENRGHNARDYSKDGWRNQQEDVSTLV